MPEQEPLGTPVYRSSAFAFRTSDEYAAVLNDEKPGYSYSRIDNPTVDAFARAMAALEGPNLPTWPAAQAFSSGMAAISTVFLTFARTGAHIVASSAIYGGTYSFLRNVAARFGVETDFVDLTDLDAVRTALRPATPQVLVTGRRNTGEQQEPVTAPTESPRDEAHRDSPTEMISTAACTLRADLASRAVGTSR